MRTTILKLFLLLIFTTGQAQNKINLTIKGKVKNSTQEFLTLNDITYYRGGLNYTGFKSIGTAIDKDGTFSLSSENISEYGAYALEFNNSAIPNLIFFKNDEIQLEFDMKDPRGTVFAKGKGSGKINMLTLEQFVHQLPKKDWEPEQCAAFSDSLLAAKLNILKAIYNKEPNNKIFVEAKNKATIQRIIKESPLSKKEYDFIEDIAYQQYYNTIAEFVFSKTPETVNEETLFNSLLFKSFNTSEYTKHITGLEYWLSRIALANILKIEYIKYINKNNRGLINQAWDKYFNSPEYTIWEHSFLKENFPAEVHDKFYADDISFHLTMGTPSKYYEDVFNYLQKSQSTNLYLSRINDFKNKVDSEPENTVYNLSDNSRYLNKEKFDALLKKYQGQNVYIVFWSVQYAGSSLINQIPALYYLEKNNNLKIIYIGIDKTEYKNLWGARIIDNQWKGDHYFMPVENNEETLKKFSDKKIYLFCEGGATFTFINKDNKISNNIENPYVLTSGKIKEYVK